MNIGPLEYVVIGVADQDDHQQFVQTLLPELKAIHEKDHIRVVDLVLVKKAADGSVTMQEVSELDQEEKPVYSGIADDLAGVLTTKDIEQLAGQIPPHSSAIVILFEHAWVIGLTEAVRKGGGVAFAGGMLPHEALKHIDAELANKEAHDV